MNFGVKIKLEAGDELIELQVLREDLSSHIEGLGALSYVEGILAMDFDGRAFEPDETDPIIRLMDKLLQKVPWILKDGDTETVPFRNSEHCYALMPHQGSVELSLYAGDELEVDEYVLEPTNVVFEEFVPGMIDIGEALAALLREGFTDEVDDNQDFQDMVSSLNGAKDAWKSYQLRQRR